MSDAHPSNSPQIAVEQESIDLLARHGQISIAFEVDRVLAASPAGGSGLAGIALSEVAVESPWRKDYDAVEGNGPAAWPVRFDVSRWGLLGAYEDHARVGGAVIAYATPGVDMLAGRDDLAVLWDLRVAPQARGRGVGSALFRGVEEWARGRGCRELKIETQNVNVRACRFYARRGCVLGGIDTHAYPQLPDEVQLLWYRSLQA